MGVGAFEAFATLALQARPRARRMRRRLAYTASRAVAVRVQRRQIHQDLVAVIPLVGDDFLDHAGVLVCRRGHRFEVRGGRRHRVRDGRGIPLVGALDRHPDDGAGLQVDRVLGFVREVCAAVLHLRDARVGVVWMLPVRVAALLRAGRSNRARSARVGVAMPDACASCGQKLLIGLARIASRDAPQGGVRLQGRASMPIVLPLSDRRAPALAVSQVKTALCVSTSIRRRVREIVECAGVTSSRPSPRKPRSASESAVRHAIPRSESMPSTYPINSSRK